MAFQLDFTKNPNQILLDQINNDNTSALTLAQISYGLPTAATGPTPPADTTITVISADGSGFTGSVNINYNRVDLSTIPGTRSTTFTLGDAVNVSDLIPEINTAYQINLTASDYEDAVLPTFTGTPDEMHDFQVAANADSVVYEGTVTLTVQGNDIPLSSVITTQTLTGLVYVQPA